MMMATTSPTQRWFAAGCHHCHRRKNHGFLVSWGLGCGATKSKIQPTWWISGTNSVLISGFILQLPRNKIVFCMIIQTAYFAVVDDDTDD